jgi:predicted O-linked N-acetylglucosamine transferase (SPINDLY family)
MGCGAGGGGGGAQTSTKPVKKPGRNEPCPCGSGKKYKQCCQRQEEAQSASTRAVGTSALTAKPDYAEACNNLGAVHYAQGKFDVAAESFRQATLLKADYAQAHYNLGLAYKAQGQLDAAAESYHRAVSLKPDYVEAHNNLGNVLQAQGKLDAAVASFQKALSIKPDYADALGNLGNVLHAQGKFDAAIDCYHKAISIKPDYSDTHSNLGNVFKDQGKLDAAIESYRRALALKPDYFIAYSNLLFALGLHSGCLPAQYLAEARNYGSKVLAQAEPYTHWPIRPAGPGMGPLRVGLVSEDLKNHPVGFFLENVLAHINPARIELVAYPTQPMEDDLTVRIKPRFSAWSPIVGLSDKAAAQKIHADGIHILVDLAGHTGQNRLPVFAWKPAPVQVSWMGYLASSGIPGMDYLLADPVSVQESQREHFTETVWYLPDSLYCFTPPVASARLAPTSLPALRNGYITFGCFQNTSKVTDAVLAVWGRILQLLPQARLRLQIKQLKEQDEREHMQQRLARAGVGPERVMMEGTVLSREGYLATHVEVDIILDTFPYPGITTTCEALWMGVPTLTLAGNTLLSRQGASLLTCAGLQDWIASDEQDYVARALAHAADINQLTQLRAGLRQSVLDSPLFDAPRFALSLEDALQDMWGQKRGVASG